MAAADVTRETPKPTPATVDNLSAWPDPIFHTYSLGQMSFDANLLSAHRHTDAPDWLLYQDHLSGWQLIEVSETDFRKENGK